MLYEQHQSEAKRPEREKVSWWDKGSNYAVVWIKWRKQEDEEVDQFRDSEKDTIVVTFILEDTNLNLMEKA